jgi:hypothetical protein
MGVAGGVEGGVMGSLPIVSRDALEVSEAVDATKPNQEREPRVSPTAPEWVTLEQAARGWRFPAAPASSQIKVTVELAGGHPRIVAVTASGALPRTAAERVLRAHLAETRECLEKAVAVGGKLSLTFRVRPDGTVADVRMVANPT